MIRITAYSLMMVILCWPSVIIPRQYAVPVYGYGVICLPGGLVAWDSDHTPNEKELNQPNYCCWNARTEAEYAWQSITTDRIVTP